MKKLKYPYQKVETKEGSAYGGNQEWLPYKFLKRTGCGIISAADVILHLHGKATISEREYIDFAKKLWLHYLPVIPGFGMNGFTMVIGLNRYFRKHSMPYHACWNFSGRKMISRIDQMLSKDIPPVLAVGPNFPFFWGKEKLHFYSKINEEKYIPAVKTKAHFVTVTGREGIWLQVSSWGKEYYINIREYQKYVKQHSSFLVSNIIYIRE